MSQAVVGWLILLAAALTFVGGFAFRSLVGRSPDTALVRRVLRRFRETALARFLFGPIHDDALDDDELDNMILMPTVVVACGLCLSAVFLLGYEALR
jgi:hypothetical protein